MNNQCALGIFVFIYQYSTLGNLSDLCESLKLVISISIYDPLVWCLICIYQRTCHLWTLFHFCPAWLLCHEHAIIHMIEHTSPFQLWKETKCWRHSAKENKFWRCCLGIETADLLRWMMTSGFPFDVDFLRHLFDSFKGAILSSEFPIPYCHILHNWVLFNGLE